MSQVNHAHVYHFTRGWLGPVGKQLTVMVMLCFIPIRVQGNSCGSGAQKEKLGAQFLILMVSNPPLGPPLGQSQRDFQAGHTHLCE